MTATEKKQSDALADFRKRMAAVRARMQVILDKRDQPRVWQRMEIPLPLPPENPPRAYRCKACLHADVPRERLWTCTACGRRTCEHDMRVQRVDGTGHCRSCAWARTRAFNEAFGLGRKDEEPRPAPVADGE